MTHCFCGRCIAILGHARRNPEVGKHSERLLTHFGLFSGKPICKLHFWQQFHDFLTHYFCCRCIAILGACQRQSECGETFWNTANAFWIIFRQAYLQNTLCNNFIISWRIFYYGDLPPLCAVLRVIQVPETPVFVDKFVCTFTWFIYSYSKYGITISKSRKSALKFTFPQHNYGQD